MYGRAPDSMETVIEVFHGLLAKYPAEKALKAMETWIERSQEFPTVADIVGLIQRNGRPPVSKEIYIAISKKDGADRTAEDWQYMRDYEAEQRGEEWGESESAKINSISAVRRENARLHAEIKRLTAELNRVAGLLRIGRENPQPMHQQAPMGEKIFRTVQAMRDGGAAQNDIEEFIASSAHSDGFEGLEGGDDSMDLSGFVSRIINTARL